MGERQALPTLEKIRTEVEAAREVDPALLDGYENIEAYRARINGLAGAARSADATAYRAGGDVRAVPLSIDEQRRRAGALLALVGGETARIPLAEYVELGYLAETAEQLLAAGITPAVVSAVVSGDLRRARDKARRAKRKR